jgi:hypothetical protein
VVCNLRPASVFEHNIRCSVGTKSLGALGTPVQFVEQYFGRNGFVYIIWGHPIFSDCTVGEMRKIRSSELHHPLTGSALSSVNNNNNNHYYYYSCYLSFMISGAFAGAKAAGA